MKTSSSIDALILGAVIAFSTAAQGEFLSYDSDFSTAPADATLHGNASLTDGVLQLTPAVINRVGSLVIGNFTNENTVTVFDVVLDAFTGNATNAALPADGWCFVWGDVPALSFGENGPANFSGLVVSFDYFVNSPEPGREVTVTWNGVQIGSVLYNSYTNSTVPVHIRLRQGGLLDVWHNGVRLFEGLSIPNFTGITSPKWGFGARTGGQTAKVTLDNLRIYPEPILVTNLSTSGEGSLPHSVEAAANVYPGPNQIQFKDSLDGQTIILTGTPLQINNQTLVVDASTLANGITVNANQSSRVLVSGASSANLFLNRVKLTGGKLTGSLPGAGLYWDASLEMLDSSITNCQTDHVGGAMILADSGTIKATRCTFSGNVGSGGGGMMWMQGSSKLTLHHCTASGNSSANNIGAAFAFLGGTTMLDHCTISSNNSSSSVGGIYMQSPANLNLKIRSSQATPPLRIPTLISAAAHSPAKEPILSEW